MNFTREPIIETIITPKEGYKLLLRNSKVGSAQEEYSVDAVEVVSFGHSLFFRSLERPKSFLVPMSDYEVVETKETRVALKTAGVERSIKIGGGREASVRAPREASGQPTEELAQSEEAEQQPHTGQPAPAGARLDKKRGRRRHRRGRLNEERPEGRETEHKDETALSPGESAEGGGAHDETRVSSSTFSTLFPPPPTLISETIGRYKDAPFSEGALLAKSVEPPKNEETSSPHVHQILPVSEPDQGSFPDEDHD